MRNESKFPFPKILSGSLQLGPFPVEKLKHVDKPTNIINNIQRIDQRDIATNKAKLGEYGLAVQKGWQARLERDPITESMRDIRKHLCVIKRNEVATAKAPITEDPLVLSRHIKRLGYFLKADIMGISRLPQSAVYSHDMNGNPINLTYKFAIVILMQKDYRSVHASAGHDFIADALSFQVYQRLGFVAETISNYIRRLGYPALPQSNFSGYNVLIPPLLLHAGLGEVSRAGIILNPFLGLSHKAAAVITDMPLISDKPIDFGLQDFCRRCRRCAEMCPAKAIPTGDKVMYNGYETWKLDIKRCASFQNLNKQGFMCNTCVKVCPWTRPNTWPHKVIRSLVRRSALARTIAIQGDRLFPNTGANYPEKWWFDLAYNKGILQLAGKSKERQTE